MRKIIVLLGLVLLVSGCSNPSTPPGFEGYVTQGAVFGSARFYETQVGPTSTGFGWMLSATNINVQWQTLSEEFQLMSADNLNLSFHAHVIMRPKPNSVRIIVESYGGENWYERNVKQPFRNAVYEAVPAYNALDAKDKREEISSTVTKKFLDYLKDKPFEVQAIVIGTINFPQIVASAQEQKISKQTQLEQKKFEIQIAQQDAQVRIEEAKGIAEAQKIINVTLTSNYLQHEAIRAQEKMAGSPSHTVVYIPSGNNGIPLVNAVNPKD